MDTTRKASKQVHRHRKFARKGSNAGQSQGAHRRWVGNKKVKKGRVGGSKIKLLPECHVGRLDGLHVSMDQSNVRVGLFLGLPLAAITALTYQ